VAASRDHGFLVELLAAFEGVAAEVVVHLKPFACEIQVEC
jgi:hypothetical protein